ncbi:MAG TPA: double-strand break repair protein AddB [Rhizomicrobium sp.]
MSSRIFTIPAGTGFAEALARGVIARLDAEREPLRLADATIFLPTQRATRTLSEAFARVLGGAALLPRIRALGDGEDDFQSGSSEDLALLPAIDPVRRRLLLATLVLRWHENTGRPAPGFAQAASLARSLAGFLDEAETQQADLGRLETLAPAALAEHWQTVRDFLVTLRDSWPDVLAAENALDPSCRRNALLAALAQRYRDNPVQQPVIAAGTTGSIPATAGLLAAIATLPHGMVVLPALDRELDEASWEQLGPGHAQYGLKQVLARLGVSRAEIADWTPTAEDTPRLTMLREALRPAPTTDAWRALAEHDPSPIARGLDGITVLEAAHPGEEATSIALMLREAIEQSGRSAALVTPDRALARRVAGELARWDIAIDDSAGTPLARTPPGTFLSLLAEAAAEQFTPVALLALLKHPLASGGVAQAVFRRSVRALDRLVLRGPRPDARLAGIAKAIARARHEAGDSALAPVLGDVAHWFAELTVCLAPFAEVMARTQTPLDALVRCHSETAERLAANDTTSGAELLWRNEAGEQAGKFVGDLLTAGANLPDIAPSAYPSLFAMMAEERAVRPPFGRHPRLAILGPLEARLQQFDVVVLGGLNEATWPQTASADPWLSRPMREALGFESPERAIGLAAHDFATLAAAPRVVLTRALKVDGTPTVASRWLQRLRQLARGLGLENRLACVAPYAVYAQLLSKPDDPIAAEKRPEPRPPVSVRPRRLSATGVEEWIRDPYAIYAKHVLRLKPLQPLEAEIGPMDRGSVIHAILEQFIRDGAGGDDALANLIARADATFADHDIPQATLALWRPRFVRAAKWLVIEEGRRQRDILRSFVELKGETIFEGPAGPFTLNARADRIDLLHAGGASIIDYKTGLPPSDSQVQSFAPQLPLEALILERGGFAEIGVCEATQLVYIRFAGGAVAGDYHLVKGDLRDLLTKTERRLVDYIAAFDSEDTPYLPREAPFRAAMSNDYDHLSRMREWAVAGWEDA